MCWNPWFYSVSRDAHTLHEKQRGPDNAIQVANVAQIISCTASMKLFLSFDLSIYRFIYLCHRATLVCKFDLLETYLGVQICHFSCLFFKVVCLQGKSDFSRNRWTFTNLDRDPENTMKSGVSEDDVQTWRFLAVAFCELLTVTVAIAVLNAFGYVDVNNIAKNDKMNVATWQQNQTTNTKTTPKH